MGEKAYRQARIDESLNFRRPSGGPTHEPEERGECQPLRTAGLCRWGLSTPTASPAPPFRLKTRSCKHDVTSAYTVIEVRAKASGAEPVGQRERVEDRGWALALCRPARSVASISGSEPRATLYHHKCEKSAPENARPGWGAVAEQTVTLADSAGVLTRRRPTHHAAGCHRRTPRGWTTFIVSGRPSKSPIISRCGSNSKPTLRTPTSPQ